jgi:putative phosphoribosyl transferase
MQGLRDRFLRSRRDLAPHPLRDRVEAGQKLAVQLRAYGGRADVLVLALPRGGVPVAFEIAKALDAPLDILVVRKLGVPGYEELAMGAIASGGQRVLNDEVIDAMQVTQQEIDAVSAREQREIERRDFAYRGERAPIEVEGRVVILVDDGIATGATLRAALAALRRQKPARLIVAVGVAPLQSYELLENEADELVSRKTPEPLNAVGVWYSDFSPTSDDEVRALMAEAASFGHPAAATSNADATTHGATARHTDEPPETTPVTIQAGPVVLYGDLTIPRGATGIVLFAHGSGSSRFSPRNRQVAQALQAEGLATLLFDLLTPAEEEIDIQTRQFRFDIDLLAKRLAATTDWLRRQSPTAHLRIGYFGASTGAAAALIAAALRPQMIDAVVSRGGRPDLAMAVLAQVKAPVLLIVGGDDEAVIQMNKRALARLRSEAKLEIVPGATHLFEEPGTLEQVATLAAAWFRRFLAA